MKIAVTKRSEVSSACHSRSRMKTDGRAWLVPHAFSFISFRKVNNFRATHQAVTVQYCTLSNVPKVLNRQADERCWRFRGSSETLSTSVRVTGCLSCFAFFLNAAKLL